MNHTNSNLNTTNAQEAHARSQSSNRSAMEARTARTKRDELFTILRDWTRIFMNSPIWILTILFGFSAMMEIVFSWPMYQDLMSQMLGYANPAPSFVGALFIISWGVITSHLIAKALSQSVFQYTIYNILKFSGHPIPRAAAEEKARIKRRRDLLWGLLCGAVLLYVVAGISWQRVWFISVITHADYSLTHRLLPVIAVLVEIVSGIYIGYLIHRFRTWRKAKKLEKNYLDEKENCAYQATMANEHYQLAVEKKEKSFYSKDLHDCLYRFEHRSQDKEDYIDEVPELKRLKVIVADESGLRAGIHLAGILSNGEYCNSIWTNEQGEGILSWNSEAKEVMTLFTGEQQHKGPYRQNSTIRLEIRTPTQIEST